MAIEKMVAEVVAEVNDQSFVKAWQEAWLYARDIKKELDKNTLFKLQLDKANTKIELENARVLLRQAKKDWDEALTLRYTIKTDELQSKLTEAGRRLNNFKNTGDTWVSRLQAKFNQLSKDISWISPIMWTLVQKTWNWLWHLSWLVWELSTKFGALAIWAGLLALWKQALFLWDKLEQANISFTTMLWSEEKAKNLLEDLAIFASNTPFELIWLRDTAKQLLAFGIDSEQIIPTLKALWDVSAWLSVPIEQVAYAYWQVRVAWRLMWWELMQFTNAWVPMIEYLSKVMWVAQKDVKKMVSEWKVWFWDVQKAFALMTSEWERFGNNMEKQTTTLSWKWSNLKDTFDKFLEWVWTDIIPFAKWVVTIFSFVLTWVQKLYYWFKIAFNFIDWIVWFTILGITNQFHKLFEFFKNYQENVNIFAKNIWLAFSNFPWTIAKFLDKALENLEWFINHSIKWINKLAKALWMEWIWEVKFWRIWDKFWEQPQFQQFNLWIARDLEDTWKKYFKKQMDDILKIVEDWTEVQKDLNTELKISDDDLTESEKSNAKSKAKTKEDLLQAELEQRKKFEKYQEELQKRKEEKEKKRQEKIEKATDLIKDYYNTIADTLEKSQDKIDDFNDKIDETSKKIKDLQDDLKWEWLDVWVSLAEKEQDLKSQIKKLEDENAWIKKLSKLSETSLIDIWEWDVWWVTWSKALEYKKLVEELQTIQNNANLISEQAKEIAWENESERLIREYNEKKAKIEQEILDEQAKLAEFTRLKDEEKAIYDQIDQYRTTLEENFTTLLKGETLKRINELEKIRQKAIETANALAKAGVTYNTTNENNVNVNLQGTWYASADAYNISEKLVPIINKAQKWINQQ